MTEYLFVYGSLAPGEPNEGLLAGVEGAWSPAKVRGILRDEGWGADMGFPGIVLDDAADEVCGQVFASEALCDLWRRLDALEGSDYRRVLAQATLEDGSVVPAFVYTLETSPETDE
jgi:gamma-glutamylcyclotransferase (GGCT)/AIG2-like uncharacterized protein YtfP